MRIMLATAIFLAGCLHARGPATGAAKVDPETIRAFDLLINDAESIDDAAAFAKAKGMSREDWIGPADRAYWSFMRAGIHAPAAEIASRFRFPPRAVAMALEAARESYEAALGAYLRDKGREGDRRRLSAAIWKLAIEIRVACRYAPEKDARKTVERSVYLGQISNTPGVLYPLLDEGCPVDSALRMSIIDAAVLNDKDDFAIRHGAASGWDDVRTSQFLWRYFFYGDCTNGVRALAAFKVTVAEGARIVENANCETEFIDSSRWNLDPKAADGWFFAAVRGKKFNLALELLPLGTHGENGQAFLCQEAMRGGEEAKLVEALKMHLNFHDGFMACAWERGRYRFIANFSLTIDWQRKAFDKLIELRKWEDAAEAAQFGASEGLRTEGVLIAFRAAMAAGVFKSGRYFVARYGPVKDKPGLVTQEMYDEERDKWYAARQAGPDPEWMKEGARKTEPKAKAKPKRGRRKPPCPDGEWCP